MCFLYWSIIFILFLFDFINFFNLYFSSGWVSIASGFALFSNLYSYLYLFYFTYSFSNVSNCLMYCSRSDSFFYLIYMIFVLRASAVFFFDPISAIFFFISSSCFFICCTNIFYDSM